jgi:translation initiation factor 1 (eIF-1/SUI1)
MTHSLHRIGTKSNLKEDYVILAMVARGYNDTNPEARKKLIKIGEILEQHNPTNMIIKPAWKVSTVIQGAFENEKDVKEVLKVLKKEDLGVSIVVSGLISEITPVFKDIDLKPHTIHLSLGIFGKKEKLPSEEILELTTMCGHHCISPQSVENYVNLIKKGKISVEKAAEKLAKPCVCGIFNPKRATMILRKLTVK